MKNVLMVFSLLLALSCGCLSAGEPKFLLYKNQEHHFSLEYANGWEKIEQEDNPVVAFYSPKEGDEDTFLENLNVGVEDLSDYPDLTLGEYCDVANGLIQNATADYQLVSKNGAVVGSNPAIQYVFTGKIRDRDLKVMQMITLKNQRAYVLTYNAEPDKYSTFSGDVEMMVDSFGFTP